MVDKSKLVEKQRQVRDWTRRTLGEFPEQQALLRGSPQQFTVNAALNKIATGDSIEDAEAGVLETIVLPQMRPALPVVDGEVGPWPPAWERLNEVSIRERFRSICASIGLLKASSPSTFGSLGTAFLVSPDLVMTTRHTAELFTTGRGVRNLSFAPGFTSLHVDFGGGGEVDSEIASPVTEVVMMHPYLDVAVLRIEPSHSLTPLRLWARDPSDMLERDIAVIGYPAWDSRVSSELQERVFAGRPGIKRIMPGRVLPPRMVAALGQQQVPLSHDAITLGGKSGAPVIDIETGAVVGVSYLSFYLVANHAVPASEMALDRRIWDLGIHFEDAPLPESGSPWEDQWERAGEMPDLAEPTPAPGSADAIVNAAKHQIDERFPETAAFRQFLAEHGYREVVDAVPEKAATKELVRALQRRGAIDEKFLQTLGVTPVIAPAAPPSEPWLQGPMLDRVLDVVAPISPEIIEVQATGSKFRSFVVNAEGKFDSATATIKRLASDPRPEAGRALTWLIRRLFESLDTSKSEEVTTLSEATAELEGKTEKEATLIQDADALTLASEPPRMQSIESVKAGIEAARSVVAIRLPEGKGKSRRIGSSGWLLTPSLVVVPAHVLEYDDPNQPHMQSQDERAREGVIVFDFDQASDKGREVPIASLLWSDAELDLAVVRLAQPVSDRRPLKLRPDPPAPSSVLQLIHHPFLGPKQISGYGRLIRHDGHEVLYLLDTSPGSAGAPVFDGSWSVVATHRAFQFYRRAAEDQPVRAKLGTATGAFLKRLRNRQGVPDEVWREIVGGQPALKMIDPNLRRQLGEMGEKDTAPVVVQLLEGSVALDDVAGFHVDSQSEAIVTGVANRQAISELISHPAVQSVEISRAAGSSLEWQDTVPYIGAARIHIAPHGEKGDKALIGVIDTGIDIFHEAFLDDTGKTRILAFWDQLDERAPSGQSTRAVTQSPASDALAQQLGLRYGAVYFADDLQRFLDGVDQRPQQFPKTSGMSHGTAVTSIAAGRPSGGAAAEAFAGGVAPAARLIVVRYDLQHASVGYSKGHIDGLAFIHAYAAILDLPVVVNISNGMNSGAHDGTTTLENKCNIFTENGLLRGRVIVKSAGNERLQGRHAVIEVGNGSRKNLRWRSIPTKSGQKDPEVFELWFHYLNRYRFRLIGPTGGPSPAIEGTPPLHKLNEYLPNGNLVNALLSPSHNESDGLLSLSIEPGKLAEVERGNWMLEITGLQVTNKEPIHAWTEKLDSRNVYFQSDAKDECTVTIPGTASSVISVGAIRPGEVMELYEQSSIGPTRKGVEKPEIVAPGVEVYGAGADRVNLRSATGTDGTSLSAPHVTGAIALALSARVRAGRPAPNSSTIRKALIESARHRSGMIWNPETGYGELDAAAFFENIMDPLSP
jgi:endonuclease G